MCLAVSGKIVSVEKGKAKVQLGSEIVEALNAVNAKKGEIVLVQQGLVVEKSE